MSIYIDIYTHIYINIDTNINISASRRHCKGCFDGVTVRTISDICSFKFDNIMHLAT